MSKVVLKPGDYVLTKDIENESQFRAVVEALSQASAKDYGDSAEILLEEVVVGLDARDGAVYGSALDAFFLERAWTGRQMTPEQVLGTDSEWSGGLPPVGDRGLDNDGDIVEVVAHHAGHAVCYMVDYAGYQYVETPYDEIRPIRSEQDKAVEEMMRIMMANGNSYGDAARALYRAGYRK